MWLLVLALGVAFWGCAKRPVSLPPEGSTTQPAAQAEAESRTPEAAQEASLSTPKQGLVKEEVLAPSSKSAKEERLLQNRSNSFTGEALLLLRPSFLILMTTPSGQICVPD